MTLRIDLLEGKYTYLYDKGHQEVLRNGEPWRDLTGDKFIHAMASEIEYLREQVEQLQIQLNTLNDERFSNGHD